MHLVPSQQAQIAIYYLGRPSPLTPLMGAVYLKSRSLAYQNGRETAFFSDSRGLLHRNVNIPGLCKVVYLQYKTRSVVKSRNSYKVSIEIQH
jgi:hypothetical protein